jgi:ankyrin repeat protein
LDDDLREILNGIQEAVEYLGIQLTAVNQRGHFGNTPLKVVAVRGDLHAARLLLDAGAEVNAVNEDGFTALHHAASHGHTEIVALLLERGAFLEARNADGRTPLELARLLGKHDVVGLLETRRKTSK